MRKNVGNGDRFLRIILGVIVLIFGLSDSLDGMFKWIALALGLILVITSLATDPKYLSLLPEKSAPLFPTKMTSIK